MAEDKLPHFAEDDNVVRARAFWNENGKPIIVGIIIGLSGIVGYNYWQNYQQTEKEKASVIFAELRAGQRGLEVEFDVDIGLEIDTSIDIAPMANELKEKYSSTAYANLAAFALAKQFVEKNDLASAAHELNWVIDNSGDPGFRHIAKLRMASVLLAQENPAQALEILTTSDKGSFESRYHELIGDVYVQRGQNGDSEQARIEYQKSLQALPDGSDNAKLIQLKLDSVGEN